MFYEYWGFNEWCTITTIILSVVAIIIAIWSSHSTSKDAEKQIREIKNLSALQIETSIKQIEAEIQKAMANVELAKRESKEIDEINNGGLSYMKEYRDEMMRRHQNSKSQRELQSYNEYSRNLNEIRKELLKLKKRLV